MSKYLLDTDVAIEVIRGRRRGLVERLASMAHDDVALSVVTVAEMFFGAWRSQTPEQSVTLCRTFCDSFDVLPLTRAACEISAEVRAKLETDGRRIGPYDVLIAGIALVEHRIMVTHNTREFGRIPDLKIEDWIVE